MLLAIKSSSISVSRKKRKYKSIKIIHSDSWLCDSFLTKLTVFYMYIRVESLMEHLPYNTKLWQNYSTRVFEWENFSELSKYSVTF